MATQKRRVIYMSDEEWAALGMVAQDQGETISGVIRQFRKLAEEMEEKLRAELGVSPDVKGEFDTTPAVRFNTQPFTGPIPKKR
jgi:hypothetical protein